VCGVEGNASIRDLSIYDAMDVEGMMLKVVGVGVKGECRRSRVD